MTTTEVSRAEKCRVIAERLCGWRHVPEAGGGVGGEEHWTRPGHHPEHRQYVEDIPDYFTDPEAMVKVMAKANIGAMPSRGAWAAFRHATTGVELYIEEHGPTPMHAVAEAAYQWAVSRQDD